jgi:hypothetical protein
MRQGAGLGWVRPISRWAASALPRFGPPYVFQLLCHILDQDRTLRITATCLAIDRR